MRNHPLLAAAAGLAFLAGLAATADAQDAAGEWIERPTKLELQEAAQRQSGQQGSKR